MHRKASSNSRRWIATVGLHQKAARSAKRSLGASAPVQQPATLPVPDSGGNAIVAERWQRVLPLSGRTITGEVGFTFDGASIPPWLWTFYRLHPFHPDILADALGHDILVRAELLPSAACNLEFRAMLMENSKRGAEVAGQFYLGVVLATHSVWSQHTKQSIADARRFCTITP